MRRAGYLAGLMVGLLVLCMSVGAAENLYPYSSADFEDGTIGDWTITDGDPSGLWTIEDDPQGNNKFLSVDKVGGTPGDLYIEFPTYTYTGEPNSLNPAGPEFRITFRYSNARFNGNDFSQWGVSLGTTEQPSYYRLQTTDLLYPGGNHFAFVVNGSSDSRWGYDFTNATGIHWYWMTFAYEASTRTLYGKVYDPLTGFEEESYWAVPYHIDTINRIALDVSLASMGKAWLFDDIQVEIMKEPGSCSDVLLYGSLAGDFNNDCAVNLPDLAILASDWLRCTDPANEDCREAAAELVVDAGVAVNENTSLTGLGDLELLRSFFHSGSWESAIDADTWAWLSQVDVDKHRMINMGEHFDSGVFTPTARLIAALDDAYDLGLIPHVIVGQANPFAIDVWLWNSSDWDNYEDYCYDVIEYVAAVYDPNTADSIPSGFSPAYFELGNEDDTKTEAWYFQGSTYPNMGTAAMYNAYYAIYQRWAAAADRVAADYPGLDINMGGPSLTSFTFGGVYGAFDWAEKFAADCGNDNTRVDFLSWHFYGNNNSILSYPAPSVYPSLAATNANIRSALDTAGLADTEIAITEWGPDFHTSRTLQGRLNADNMGAAWTAAALYDMMISGTDLAVELIFRDHYEPPVGGEPADIGNWGWPSFLDASSSYPKPMFNVFKMYTMMPGERVSCSGLSGDLGAVASADNSGVGVVLYNFDIDWSTRADMTTEQSLRVVVNNVPFVGMARIRRYVIDEDTSNMMAYIDAGLPVDADAVSLQEVESYELPVVAGAVETFITDVPNASVTLWLIDPAP